jgi:surface antigen
MITSTIWNKTAGAASALVLVAALSACESSQVGQKTQIGAVGGAVGGGVIAAAAGAGGAGIAAGALLGGLLGGGVGYYLDDQDKKTQAEQTHQSLQDAPNGQITTWRNPDSGNYGTVTPLNDYYDNSGRYCRDFRQTVNVNGQNETADGTACRSSDGNWQIV